MKTGYKVSRRPLPKIFYIILLGLEAILKSCGAKDALLFYQHNPMYELNTKLIESGICFNLFSEYGVGKKLEEMIKELFKNLELDPEKYLDNVFYQEIIEYSPIISNILYKEDTREESKWIKNYSSEKLLKKDKIEAERLERLSPLFNFSSKKLKTCSCDFCLEFIKFNYPREKYIDEIILQVLLQITN
jgi:hypothetical protein